MHSIALICSHGCTHLARRPEQELLSEKTHPVQALKPQSVSVDVPLSKSVLHHPLQVPAGAGVGEGGVAASDEHVTSESGNVHVLHLAMSHTSLAVFFPFVTSATHHSGQPCGNSHAASGAGVGEGGVASII